MASENQAVQDTGVMLGIHLDIGHASIGWSVNEVTQPVIFLGCGTVLFQKDGCLASKRRQNRRQRRHIRSTRQRMARIALLLQFVGAMTEEATRRPGGAWPWKLAAEALSHGRRLNWQEMWDVLRWYAHNRGYDGNQLWSGKGRDDDKEQRESLENARHLMERHGTQTMAETVCAVLGVPPGGKKCAGRGRYKSKKDGASYPREIVVGELRRILESHAGILPGISPEFVRALLGSPKDDPEAWKALPCDAIRLPKRYVGGILFGQLAPRFDNRIIGNCPVSGEHLPAKSSPEFLEYRWAMFLANIRVRRHGTGEITPLSAAERAAVTKEMREKGHFTKTTLKQAVKRAAGTDEGNIDDMLLHPDAEDALVLHPALKEAHSARLKEIYPMLPGNVRGRILARLRRGKTLSLREIREWLEDPAAFDHVVEAKLSKSKKTNDDPLAATLKAGYPTGRAPYSREAMRKAVAEVMEGRDPREEGGTLYLASQAGKTLAEEDLDNKTNNHMVRHRLKIMLRLLADIVEEYACGDKSRIDHVTVEVNREVKDMSGKKTKEIAQDLGLRLKSHKDAAEYAAKELGIPKHRLGGALIRKVRIAMDMDWKCPYTGQQYDIHQLRGDTMDLDHIIPHSKRNSDSLDSLVLTFKQVNLWKGNQGALDFITVHGGEQVPGAPNLSILTPARYQELVEGLEKMRGGHPDDARRRKNRCQRLKMRMVEKEATQGFTPRDLTVSSHLVKLALAAVAYHFRDGECPPKIRAIPGRITNEARMAWKVMDCLATVNPMVLAEDNTLKTKTEIRDVTHLHHAVDAVTLGLASDAIPEDGTVWGLMLKRRLNSPADRGQLEKTGAFRFDASGRPSLRELPEETRQSILRCLSERRVVTHIPASRHGAALEENIRGIVSIADGEVVLRQRTTNEKGEYQGIRETREVVGKVLGVAPRGKSKLQAVKGALVINENFGVALDPVPEVIPFHQVWRRIGDIKKKNIGVMPRIIRNGMLIKVESGKYAGVWKVFSVKNAKVGILIDMALADTVKLYNKTPGHCINVLLGTLLKNGLSILPTRYTGSQSCPTT